MSDRRYFDVPEDKGQSYNVQVVRALGRALKVDPSLDTIFVSSLLWNALKALGWDLDPNEQEGEYALTQITCGRKVYCWCDPELDDYAITAEVETEENEES